MQYGARARQDRCLYNFRLDYEIQGDLKTILWINAQFLTAVEIAL
jgi:hypothetical protein